VTKCGTIWWLVCWTASSWCTWQCVITHETAGFKQAAYTMH
jgi:hypothetical protein